MCSLVFEAAVIHIAGESCIVDCQQCDMQCCGRIVVAKVQAKVQVDEPALREGLPLKQDRWESYLEWAVDSFRLSTAVAQPHTQIVTHLCYSDFQDILKVSTLVAFTSALLSSTMREDFVWFCVMIDLDAAIWPVCWLFASFRQLHWLYPGL